MAPPIVQVNSKTWKIDYSPDFSVEIGDINSTTFKPHTKFSLWGGECEFGFSFPTTSTNNAILDGNRLHWTWNYIDMYFYPIDPDGQNEGGSFEFEVVLNSKPPTNTITFNLNKFHLLLYYQSDVLTQHEIDMGSFRPDNAKQSIAAYHDSKKNGRYRTGKAFHLYRPKATDALGNWIWLDMTLNEQNGQITISIPNNFLNTATYPIVIDPTFGQTSKGASSTTGGTNWALSTKVTGGAGTADSISLWCDSGATVHFKPILWLDSDKSIITNGVGPIGLVPATSSTPLQVDYVSKPTVSAIAYQLGFVQESTFNIYYDAGGAGDGWYDISNSYTTPNDLTSGATDTFIYSIFVTYTGENVFPFTDDFTGTNGNPWSSTKWTTSVG